MLPSTIFGVLTLQLAAAASIPKVDSAGTSDGKGTRWELTCNDPTTYTCLAEDAARAIDYLRSIGHSDCVVPAGNLNVIEFKRVGTAIIKGRNVCEARQSSSCNDVARGAGKIMDRCTWFDGFINRVEGSNAAWGNGCIVVSIGQVPI